MQVDLDFQRSAQTVAHNVHQIQEFRLGEKLPLEGQKPGWGELRRGLGCWLASCHVVRLVGLP